MKKIKLEQTLGEDSGFAENISHTVEAKKILTSDELIQVYVACDLNLTYEQIASIFGCSYEQVKMIQDNRISVMGTEEKSIIREDKIAFLEECVFEYLQRIQYHTDCYFDENTAKIKAEEFQKLIKIENFVPTANWIKCFQKRFKFSLILGKLILKRTPPSSFHSKVIIPYCFRHRPTESSDFGWSPSISHHQEIHRNRSRKVKFYEQVVWEYTKRAELRYGNSLTHEILLEAALKFRDLLKLEDFNTDHKWIVEFKKQFDLEKIQSRCPALKPIVYISLDLKDIISFCSRQKSTLQPTRQILSCTSKNDLLNMIPPFKKIRLSSDHLLKKSPNISCGNADQAKNGDDCEIKSKCDEAYQLLDESNSIGFHYVPCEVRSIEDALKSLKPLEEFALLSSNYRAIGLITQLEKVFKEAMEE